MPESRARRGAGLTWKQGPFSLGSGGTYAGRGAPKDPDGLLVTLCHVPTATMQDFAWPSLQNAHSLAPLVPHSFFSPLCLFLQVFPTSPLMGSLSPNAHNVLCS